MDFGLARVETVRRALGLRFSCPVVTVGGTNGKGSTCALLESILRCAGYRVGCYTSPHLLRYNERVRLDGREVDDRCLVNAFECIERTRGDVSLTYFEFGTLAAALLFVQSALDVVVLEVGLGGRLDAVNAFDADCAVITSIGLDHQAYLGDTREMIGAEKAGIFRSGRPAIIADPEPPASLLERADQIGAQVQLIERDFGAVPQGAQWTYWSTATRRAGLPWPSLRGSYQLLNAAAALAALDSLRARIPVDMGAVRRGLVEVELPGRFQVLPGRPVMVLDVAHNPHAAHRLRDAFRSIPGAGRRLAVFAMLRDKDIEGVARVMADTVDAWFLAPVPGLRGADNDLLQAALRACAVRPEAQGVYADVASALHAARESAAPDDKIIVFGSFLTVSAAMSALTS